MDHSRDRFGNLGLEERGARICPCNFTVNYRLKCPAESMGPVDRHLAKRNQRQDPSERTKKGWGPSCAAGTGGLSLGRGRSLQESGGLSPNNKHSSRDLSSHFKVKVWEALPRWLWQI